VAEGSLTVRQAGTARTAIESIAAVVVCTAVVAALDQVAPIAGLAVVYLLAVLFVAIRHGERWALATALVSVMTLNFLFIPPRYRVGINDSEHVVALAVFLIAAVVVGRLAAATRAKTVEAEERARIATAREREAALLAAAASSLLAGVDVETQLKTIERTGGESGDSSGVRVEVAATPSPQPGEDTIRLPTASRPAWLHVRSDGAWPEHHRQRVAGAMAHLIDAALERERLTGQAAEVEAARRADVAKTALLHAISHDLRSPLTAIRAAASGLADSELPEADRSELVSVIAVESLRLGKLVDDLLDLSRIEVEAIEPNPDWCDLHEVVLNAARQVRSNGDESRLELRLADLPLVHADPTQLERVFVNLIDNALRFSPPGTKARVSGSVVGNRVVVRVVDHGPGVPKALRHRIFEPFVRGDGAGPGSGLGLAICRGFVEANGGRIALQTGVGEETSFVVSFPLVPQPASA
jgi:two-component system, OmpR family, sensor histidine kinase KdpD